MSVDDLGSQAKWRWFLCGGVIVQFLGLIPVPHASVFPGMLILLLALVFWKKSVLCALTLPTSLRELRVLLILQCALMLGFYVFSLCLFKTSGRNLHLLAQAGTFAVSGLLFVKLVIQVLGEEILLRPALFHVTAGFKINPWILTLGFSIVFSLLHVLNFYVLSGEILSFLTVVNLGLFVALGNIWYQKHKSLSLPFALHLSWNFVRFHFDFSFLSTKDGSLRVDESVLEARSFDFFEGSLFLSAFLTLALLIVQFKEKPSKTNRTK